MLDTGGFVLRLTRPSCVTVFHSIGWHQILCAALPVAAAARGRASCLQLQLLLHGLCGSVTENKGPKSMFWSHRQVARTHILQEQIPKGNCIHCGLLCCCHCCRHALLVVLIGARKWQQHLHTHKGAVLGVLGCRVRGSGPHWCKEVAAVPWYRGEWGGVAVVLQGK